jgi:hypothetical protein
MNIRRVVVDLVLLTSAFPFVASRPARAGIIYSDLSGTASPGAYVVGEYSPGNSYVIGAAFTPGGQTYVLTQIQALLSFSSGTNDMIVGLYSDSGGIPGATPLESWNLNGVLGSSPTIETLTSVAKPALDAGHQYWITAAMADPTSTGLWWINNIGGLCCGEPGEVQGIATSALNGGPFSPGALTGVGFHAFAVSGDPVPEPSSFLLLPVALFALLSARKRRPSSTF